MLDVDWEKIAHDNCYNPDDGTLPANPAYVLYTSDLAGSKGVMVTHHNVVRLFMETDHCYQVGAGDMRRCFTPMQVVHQSGKFGVRCYPLGVNDSFFVFSGNSLQVTQVLVRICDAWGVTMSLRSLFHYPTVRALTLHLETLRLVCAERSGPAAINLVTGTI